ncbi:uncharacterized protein EHS24_005023 [Apiotrichum porosum]|uniref:Myb-like domain-containing protein n=1 Tax=Apiotrichum porosum TaxID=105984 RepID=A0A427Y6N5_9TREE|nr:uncharacterized protein EHS24_005023 [Apiotrichum porosum]RSH86751.1 hypothetical protein EHS24_005023 [Apiotrichum porosum]
MPPRTKRKASESEIEEKKPSTKKARRPRTEWSAAEEAYLVDVINATIASSGGLWSLIKNHPEIGQRSNFGVKKHWDGMCGRILADLKDTSTAKAGNKGKGKEPNGKQDVKPKMEFEDSE